MRQLLCPYKEPIFTRGNIYKDIVTFLPWVVTAGGLGEREAAFGDGGEVGVGEHGYLLIFFGHELHEFI